jgi:hypothetical protein
MLDQSGMQFQLEMGMNHGDYSHFAVAAVLFQIQTE